MPHHDSASYFLLDSHQGRNVNDGWRKQYLQDLKIASTGLQLAPLPIPPVPLKDREGTFGGLENPTGAAIAPDGTIYISDLHQHRIFQLTRHEGLGPIATFFRVERGELAGGDRFVYVPTANRLERWPQGIQGDPLKFSEIEVICDRIWNIHQARQTLLDFIEADGPEEIAQEWQESYPSHLPTGSPCGRLLISPVPCLGGWGSNPRQFDRPRGLAMSPSGNLYVADSQNHRIQVFGLRGWVLKAIWGKQVQGKPKDGNAPGEFNDPWDVVVAKDGTVFIAEAGEKGIAPGNGRIQSYDCHTREFKIIDGTVLKAHHFRVLYGAEARAHFVFVPARHQLERWPQVLTGTPDFGEITRFSQRITSLEAARQLILENIGAVGATDIFAEWEAAYPDTLAVYSQAEPRFSRPSHLAIDATGRLYVVDRDYDFVKILDLQGRVLGRITYVREVPGQFGPTAVAVDAEGYLLLADGTYIQRFAVDQAGTSYDGRYAAWSGDCGGIVMDAKGRLVGVGGESGGVAEIPSADRFEKEGTFISQALDSDIDRCAWHKILLDFAGDIPSGTSVTVWTHTANELKSPAEIAELSGDDWQTGQANGPDLLVQSPPGRWLWLKLEFKGNGIDTPVLKHLKVFFPRVTYLQYLPAVYQTDPVSKAFLEKFLSIFEATAASIDTTIDQIARYFDPAGVPAEFLEWLAAWLNLVFDPSWSEATRRRLLRNTPELYRLRGTLAGLKRLIELALGINIQILEHFHLRRWLFLASHSTLGNQSQLWGNHIVGRLQLERNARIGDFALVGTGAPLRDLFRVYAHKFSVFVPAAKCRSALQEAQMRRLIELEKPAHSQYHLCRTEARFRVGIQSTVGMDTLVGAYPRLVLNHCATLGYDALLGQVPEVQGAPIVRVEQSRVGVNAVVG